MSEPIGFNRLLSLIAKFEADLALTEHDLGSLLFEILGSCGFSIRKGVTGDETQRHIGIDGDFEARFDGRNQRIAIEIKGSTRKQALESAVSHAVNIRGAGIYDRCMIVCRGSTAGVDVDYLSRRGVLGYVDLLGTRDLRSWLNKYVLPKPEEDNSCVTIIREAMRALASRLAHHPDELKIVEWRDLERILREIFKQIGFETGLTRSGKDGGFDLELKALS